MTPLMIVVTPANIIIAAQKANQTVNGKDDVSHVLSTKNIPIRYVAPSEKPMFDAVSAILPSVDRTATLMIRITI